MFPRCVKSLFVISLLTSFLLGICLAKDSPTRPNVVFIMADDLGWNELGSYGQTKIQTPNIDRLASQGMRFTDYYSGAPVCAPARCTLMTGKHLGHAEVRDNSEVGTWDSYRGQMPLSADVGTIASMMKAQGYACGAFGKWGLGEVGSTGDPLNKGFDRFFGYNCQRHAHNLFPRYLVSDREHYVLEGNDRGLTGAQYGPQVIADQLLEFIRDNRQRPFFAYYPTVIPHLALQVPEEELEQYKGKWDETPYTGKSYLPHPTPRAAYAAMITFMDKQVGRLMALLDELDLSDNTIVFFTSDNGTTMLKAQVDYEFFESVGPLRGLKGDVYEGGIRVPMIARWPGRIQPDSVTDLPTAHWDAMATIADVVGIESLPGTDGVSYLPTLLGQADRQQRHEYLLWDFAGYGGQQAVRIGPWKGVRRDLRKNPDAPVELYNLNDDIGEQHDVASDHPEIVSRIKQILIDGRTSPQVARWRTGTYSDDPAP